MKQKEYVANALKALTALEDCMRWLKRSYEICYKIGVKKDYADNELDAFETLTSRYARAADIIIYKVFRSIDAVEFENHGSLIDVLNRAHRRGFFESIEKIRQIKELRNEIAHEYVKDNIIELFGEVIEAAPELFKIFENVSAYMKKNIS
ncbi:MAG TPA: hypothetical protein PK467_11380 [Candidatus Wallbacteria bacterium]|nr:hypothetical protein [Candidatus Wallbacteria bacterium]